jgi:hypothetical protein
MPGEPYHYRSEIWANKIIAPFLLNQAFVGVFFITSCRFLIEKYLKTGDLLQIAEKTTGRTFRVIIPIAAIAMLEYFLIDCGAIKWLEYLPSVTWSTWPYAVGYTDFSHYISEILELVYLIPNAAPQITYNYCTGVLWTIPVQLQFSWTTLLGCIVAYEISSPWKRMGYYAFCIINSWYAQSWGSFFWFGILLTDLDVTYHYKTWLRGRKLILYPILWIATIACFGGLANDLITSWTGFALPIVERGIHPDISSGLPIAQTSNAGYPDYFVPRFNALVFSVGLQVLVELSPITQAIFSIKPFLIIFPHIFTIYLIHGMIFWSLGSFIAVHLSADGWPFWAVILVVGIVCYTVLFLCLPILTPVVETLGLNVTKNIWTLAREGIMKRKRTLWPFRGDLFFEGVGDGGLTAGKDEEKGGAGKGVDGGNEVEKNAARIAITEGKDKEDMERKLKHAEQIAVKVEKEDG